MRTRYRPASPRGRGSGATSVALLTRVPVAEQRLELGPLEQRAEVAVDLDLREVIVDAGDRELHLLEGALQVTRGGVGAGRRVIDVRILLRDRLCAIGDPDRGVVGFRGVRLH